MKNWEKVIGKDYILESIARDRIARLSVNARAGIDCSSMSYCDNGNAYYFFEDALKAEIDWLTQESEED